MAVDWILMAVSLLYRQWEELTDHDYLATGAWKCIGWGNLKFLAGIPMLTVTVMPAFTPIYSTSETGTFSSACTFFYPVIPFPHHVTFPMGSWGTLIVFSPSDTSLIRSFTLFHDNCVKVKPASWPGSVTLKCMFLSTKKSFGPFCHVQPRQAAMPAGFTLVLAPAPKSSAHSLLQLSIWRFFYP